MFDVSIWKFIEHILHIAVVFVPSNRKYPFIYALHLEQRKGEFTFILCTRYEPNGVIHTPSGNCDFFGVENVNADVGRKNYGPAS